MNRITCMLLIYTTVLLSGLIFGKLIDLLNWSWWWVLFPLWLDIAVLITVICFAAYRERQKDKLWQRMRKNQTDEWNKIKP
jgi:heme/copper-type cytochrome/quinol oxidase subunit 2